MNPRKKPETLRSPKGVFMYPWLTEPDTKFKTEGEYRVKLVCDQQDPEVQALIERIDAEAAASLAEAKKRARTPKERNQWATRYLPYAPVYDDEGNQTGEVEFKFSMKASGVSKATGKEWTRKPALFDAKGKLITGNVKVGSGTIGRIAFQIVPYAQTIQTGASVRLALMAAQIIELKTVDELGSAIYGFEEEDGSFEYRPEAESKEEETQEPNDGVLDLDKDEAIDNGNDDAEEAEEEDF